MKRLRNLVAALGLTLIALAASGAALAGPEAWRAEWPRTDFARTNVDLAEILSGGPPKDGIPALDAPRTTWERMYHPVTLGAALQRVEVARPSGVVPPLLSGS